MATPQPPPPPLDDANFPALSPSPPSQHSQTPTITTPYDIPLPACPKLKSPPQAPMHSSHPVPKGGISFRQRYKPIDLTTHLSKSLLADPLLTTPYSAYDGPPGNPDFARHDILLLQATLISYITGTQDASAVTSSSLLQTGLN